MSDLYWLDDAGQPVRVPSSKLLLWGRWMEHSENRVVQQPKTLGFKVSTVFLGLDHRFGDDGPPVLWETMVFDLKDPDPRERVEFTFQGRTFKLPRGLRDLECHRYTSLEDARAGHDTVVALVEAMAEAKYRQRKDSPQ